MSNSALPPRMWAVPFIAVVTSTSSAAIRRTRSPNSLAGITASPGSITFASMVVMMAISVS